MARHAMPLAREQRHKRPTKQPGCAKHQYFFSLAFLHPLKTERLNDAFCPGPVVRSVYIDHAPVRYWHSDPIAVHPLPRQPSRSLSPVELPGVVVRALKVLRSSHLVLRLEKLHSSSGQATHRALYRMRIFSDGENEIGITLLCQVQRCREIPGLEKRRAGVNATDKVHFPAPLHSGGHSMGNHGNRW